MPERDQQLSKVYRRLSALPGVTWFKERPTIHQARRAVRQSLLVTHSAAYALREFRRVGGVYQYTLRTSPSVVCLRHGISSWPFEEIFRHHAYEPPPAVNGVLEQAKLSVLDLGANVGYFGVWLLERFPAARVLGYEPDPTTSAVHEQCIRANHAGGRWSLDRSIAATAPGEQRFVAKGTGSSHVAGEDDPQESVTLPQTDVLPQIQQADLVKMDIEGGEWPIMSDPRFGGGRTRAVVLEYHPYMCPGDSPREEAMKLLRAAGFHVIDPVDPGHFPTDQGMLWGLRQPTSHAPRMGVEDASR